MVALSTSTSMNFTTTPPVSACRFPWRSLGGLLFCRVLTKWANTNKYRLLLRSPALLSQSLLYLPWKALRRCGVFAFFFFASLLAFPSLPLTLGPFSYTYFNTPRQSRKGRSRIGPLPNSSSKCLTWVLLFHARHDHGDVGRSSVSPSLLVPPLSPPRSLGSLSSLRSRTQEDERQNSFTFSSFSYVHNLELGQFMIQIRNLDSKSTVSNETLSHDSANMTFL